MKYFRFARSIARWRSAREGRMRDLRFVPRPFRGALGAAAALLAAACVAQPAYRSSGVRVPTAYDAVSPDSAPRPVASAASATQAGSTGSAPGARFSANRAAPAFWRELGDTTLVQLVEEALRASTDVRTAEARLTGVRAARRLAALELTPSVTARGSAFRTQQSMAQIPGLTSQLPQRDLWDVGFDASWEVDVFGRLQRSVSAQGALAASAQYSLDDVQLTLAAEVARTYFELRGAQRELAVAQRNAEVQRRTVGLTEDRLAAGRGTAFDTERARSVLQLTLAGVPAIESRIAASRYRIAVLLGRSPEALPAGVLQAGDLPRLPDSLHVGSPQELVRRRPDVLAAERGFAASSINVGVARTDYLPRLTLGASAGYVATQFDGLSRAGTSRVLIGPTLTFPLLDLGRVRQRVDMASAQADEARARYDATVLRAIEESEVALVAYDRAHARVGMLTDAVRSSTRAAELARERFEAGLTDFLQVLDAQRTQLEAESQLSQAHTAAAVALVATYKALGGR